ncbi:hypothetical protein OEA41_005781 [Lepraria neglecta]|uniref:Uncharacterized protein n=1 Tax=Lepraria neglecta TaxID=209136 RepID=A0AAD9Z6N8_9LECA|nr:hypothetical protein OEA41_005781 [Lepraria neglecta]
MKTSNICILTQTLSDSTATFVTEVSLAPFQESKSSAPQHSNPYVGTTHSFPTQSQLPTYTIIAIIAIIVVVCIATIALSYVVYRIYVAQRLNPPPAGWLQAVYINHPRPDGGGGGVQHVHYVPAHLGQPVPGTGQVHHVEVGGRVRGQRGGRYDGVRIEQRRQEELRRRQEELRMRERQQMEEVEEKRELLIVPGRVRRGDTERERRGRGWMARA